jgi:hypothetical protein
MKMQMTEDNKKILIGILSILVFLWLIIYIIPTFFVELFHTLLGNLILILTVVLVSTKNINYGILLAIIFIILFRFSVRKEGFTKSSVNDYLDYQKLEEPHIVFDINQLKKQASQEELDYFLQNGMWPWSKEVEDMYKEQIDKNSHVRSDPDEAVKYARKIYNQQAILQIISLQTKEGEFLTQGLQLRDTSEYKDGKGTYQYTSQLIKPGTNTYVKEFKCGVDGNMEEKQFGMGTKRLDYQELEGIIPGFKFVKNKCNPCVALKDPPEYTCPFTLKLSNEEAELPTTSKIWKYLWNIR